MGFFLQPQADVLAGRLEGVEMLVRWRREDGRWNTPGKFMSVVEEDIHLIRRLRDLPVADLADHLPRPEFPGHAGARLPGRTQHGVAYH